MSLPNEVVVSTSKLTALGDAVRGRFGVSGTKTLDELAEIVTSHLPSGYQQVEYIESTGTQYIVTNNNILTDRIVADFQYTEAATGGEFAVANQSKQNAGDLWIAMNVTYFRYGVGTGVYSAPNADLSRHTADIGISAQYFDGNQISSYSTTARNDRICLFCGDYLGEGRPHGVRLYKVELYYKNSLIHKFIPCYRKSDSVIGMYDIINGQFYTNSGTGSFTCYPAPSN